MELFCGNMNTRAWPIFQELTVLVVARNSWAAGHEVNMGTSNWSLAILHGCWQNVRAVLELACRWTAVVTGQALLIYMAENVHYMAVRNAWIGQEGDSCGSHRVICVDLQEFCTQESFARDLQKMVYTKWLVLVPDRIWKLELVFGLWLLKESFSKRVELALVHFHTQKCFSS